MLVCMTAALTIAFVPGVSPAKWARVWRERFPTVELRLRPIGSDEVDEALAGEVDMVFARVPVSDEHHAIPLWTETAVVATPKDSALAKANATQVTDADLEGLHVVDAGPVPADVGAALDLVEANVGIVVMPLSLFRAASRKDLVSRVLVGAPGTQVALVWRDEDANEFTKDFIGVVRGRTANSSRRDEDQLGGADPDAETVARPADGSAKAAGGGKTTGRGTTTGGGKATGRKIAGKSKGKGAAGKAGDANAGGGRATAANKKTVAKRSATKGTGAKSGGGKNSTGRGLQARGMKGKPKRGSKGNR